MKHARHCFQSIARWSACQHIRKDDKMYSQLVHIQLEFLEHKKPMGFQSKKKQETNNWKCRHNVFFAEKRQWNRQLDTTIMKVKCKAPKMLLSSAVHENAETAIVSHPSRRHHRGRKEKECLERSYKLKWKWNTYVEWTQRGINKPFKPECEQCCISNNVHSWNFSSSVNTSVNKISVFRRSYENKNIDTNAAVNRLLLVGRFCRSSQRAQQGNRNAHSKDIVRTTRLVW